MPKAADEPDVDDKQVRDEPRGRYVAPAVEHRAFNCPHCGALAKQHWFTVHAEPMGKDKTPTVISEEDLNAIKEQPSEDPKAHADVVSLAEKMVTGFPILYFERFNCDYRVVNVSIARCFNCDDISIWILDRLVWPTRGGAPLPNQDLPADVLADYEEADRILDLSPRGAAALLRLCIQKLCKHLECDGTNINSDIAALVQKGLDPRVQKALDIVRVIGNNAVHPGQMDLKDDRSTAGKLFGLVNLICEIMITQPKHVNEMYEAIPPDLREAIEKRDTPKT